MKIDETIIEAAKLAKEIGFKQRTLKVYHSTLSEINENWSDAHLSDHWEGYLAMDNFIPLPTIEQYTDWLLKEHNVFRETELTDEGYSTQFSTAKEWFPITYISPKDDRALKMCWKESAMEGILWVLQMIKKSL